MIQNILALIKSKSFVVFLVKPKKDVIQIKENKDRYGYIYKEKEKIGTKKMD